MHYLFAKNARHNYSMQCMIYANLKIDPKTRMKRMIWTFKAYLPRTLTCSYQQGIQEPDKDITKQLGSYQMKITYNTKFQWMMFCAAGKINYRLWCNRIILLSFTTTSCRIIRLWPTSMIFWNQLQGIEGWVLSYGILFAMLESASSLGP